MCCIAPSASRVSQFVDESEFGSSRSSRGKEAENLRKMGKGGIDIPDWRIYKVEDVPQLKAVQEKLALKGLKDPWLRNEVWRYQPAFKAIPWWRFIFRGFPMGAGLFVVAVGLEKLFSSKDDHGHGHH